MRTRARRRPRRHRTWSAVEVTPAARTRVVARVAGPLVGPTVVLVHGLGASHRYHRPLARALAGRARVVAPDLPGFGDTDGHGEVRDVPALADALADWLRATGRCGAVLVGNSLGGQVLVHLALRHPEVAGPLVLNAPTVDRHHHGWWPQAVRLALDMLLERPGLPFVLVRDYLACGPRRFSRTFSAALRDPVHRHVAGLRGRDEPVVLVRGGADRVATAAWVEELAARAGATVVTVPDGPHALNWSRPRELAAVVTTLLGQRAGAGPSAKRVTAPAVRAS